ncbi:MAG: winged helix-turn-helix domain-containing protein [Pseudomonadota bacterium]
MTASPREFNGCRFDPSDGRLQCAASDQSVTLRPQAARLLQAFLDAPGEILTRDDLIAVVWDEGAVVDFEAGLAALMRELRQALEQVGAGAELVETVPRRGYRFHGQSASKDTAEASSVPSRSSWRVLLTALLVALVAIAVLLWWSRSGQLDVIPPASGNATLAILPFQTYLPDSAADDRVGLLIADALLARLWAAELTDLDLIGRATLRPYQDQDEVATLVARDLNVGLILEGVVSLAPTGDWTVDARMLQMPQGTVVWSASISITDRETVPAREAADQLIRSLAQDWENRGPELQP